MTSLCAEKELVIASKNTKKTSLWSKIPLRNIVYYGAWILCIYLAYNVAGYEQEEGYNPYQVLGISEGADVKEIKKAYKELSKIYHPDKNKDDPDTAAEMFMK